MDTTPPGSFYTYVRSFGPGLVAVLTWLGAGDIVNAAAAGGNYGYQLMWGLALCLLLRYLFVSLIARYHLCNPRRETVLSGLYRLHPGFVSTILAGAILVGHAVAVYLLAGLSSVLLNLLGTGSQPFWAGAICFLSLTIALQPDYSRIESAFMVLAALLTASLVGLAVWAGPSPSGIAKGLFGFTLPAQLGRFDSTTILLALLGSVGGGIANLMYPYFIQRKGWDSPAHLRLQRYDLAFGLVVLLILDLSVWVVGAEVLHPRGLHVSDTGTLAALLGAVFGRAGSIVFLVGILAALFTTYVGNAAAYGYLVQDAWNILRHGPGHQNVPSDSASGRLWSAAWFILSPLPWVVLGNADFIGLTLLVNAAQVLFIPGLVLGIGWITAKKEFIGEKFRNKHIENVLIALLFVLGLLSAAVSLREVHAGLIRLVHS